MKWVVSGNIGKWIGGQEITDEAEICEYFRTILSEGLADVSNVMPEHLSDETILGQIKQLCPNGVNTAEEAEDAECNVLIFALEKLVIFPGGQLPKASTEAAE